VSIRPQRLPRDVFVGRALLFAAINWIKVPPYAALGQFTAEKRATSAALARLAVAAAWAGVRLVRHVPAERFYGIVYGLLLLVGESSSTTAGWAFARA
jgi:uncharacterized protein